MKTRTIIYVLSSAALMTSTARADDPKPPFDDAVGDAEGGNWLPCLKHVDAVVNDRDAPLDPSTKVRPLAKQVGPFAAGATPTAAELRAECVAEAKNDPGKARVWHDEMLFVGGMAAEVKEMQEHPYDRTYQTVAQELVACDRTIARATEVLGADGQVTVDSYGQPTWTGTVAQAKVQFCDAARAAIEVQKQKIVGPFTKAGIKNDKLKILDEYNYSVEIGIAGGTYTLDPKALAKANPWFSAADGDSCAGGHVITHLHRYQFDKDQKLVKESTKDYCGAVPKSAYR